ncbi:MAG: DUF423 domain-containing protein [Ignavibacteriales bacterium]|nr:DUF423 domain-containing protein [Ignavibacteriales bacterium]
MSRKFVLLGSLTAMLGVLAGAFGAHALKTRLSPEMLAVFETAVRYQMYHSFAMFVAAWAEDKYFEKYFRVAGWLFFTGICLFSGSLYLLVFSGVSWMGAITPFGGVSFIAGWLMLFWGFWRERHEG